MPFLENLQSRPLNIADTKGAKPVGLFLGQGPNALEVAVLQSVSQPSAGTLRAIWNSRLAGRATPLLIVVLHGNSAALCGPNGDQPPAFTFLNPDLVERICRAALAEPDRNAALRFLSTVIPEADAPLPGLRNEGLFATHELQRGLPMKAAQWSDARTKSSPLLNLRGEQLLEHLGYTIEATSGPVSILRGGEQRRAIAIFLDRNESPDLPSARFAQLSPVSYALAKADQENLDWVVVSETGAVFRSWVLSVYPDGNTREKQHASQYAPDRLFHDVAGITLAGSASERAVLLKEFRAYGYEIRKDGEKQVATGPEVTFTLIPAESRTLTIHLALNREKDGVYQLGDSELSLHGRKGAWVFHLPSR